MSCEKLSVLNPILSSRLNVNSFRLLNMKETFGQRLHRLRIAAALSQTELGKLIGRALGSAPISKGAISQWENDQIGSLKDENLLALARVLKMPPEELKSGALNVSLASVGLSATGTVSPALPGGNVAPKPSLPDLLEDLADRLAKADQRTRDAVGELLLRYAQAPEDGARLVKAIQALLEPDA